MRKSNHFDKQEQTEFTRFVERRNCRMKSNHLLCWSLCGVILFIVCFTAINAKGNNLYGAIKWSGVLVKKSIVVSDYKSIDVSSGICLTLTDGDKNLVFVEADEAQYEYLDIYVSGGVLNIGMKNTRSNNSMKPINVSVSARGVSTFTLSSAADVTAKTTLVGSELTFDLSSASRFNGEIACKKITAEVSSAAKLDLSGTTDFFGMDLSSASSVNAGELIAKKVVCEASSASSARVYASEELSVDASSGSNVRYGGDAKVVRIETSSGASVSKR